MPRLRLLPLAALLLFFPGCHRQAAVPPPQAPPSVAAQSLPASATLVSIAPNGSLTLRLETVTRPIAQADLASALAGRSGPVYLQAGKQVQFGTVQSVLDTLKQAGVDNIAILTP